MRVTFSLSPDTHSGPCSLLLTQQPGGSDFVYLLLNPTVAPFSENKPKSSNDQEGATQELHTFFFLPWSLHPSTPDIQVSLLSQEYSSHIAAPGHLHVQFLLLSQRSWLRHLQDEL